MTLKLWSLYVKDLKYHGITKHIDTKNNFIRDIIAQKELIPKYLPTWKVVVDPFTKSISRDMFFVHVKSLGFLSYNLCWLYGMDHYWLNIRYSIHHKMRWVFVIHIIEYVNGTYTYILLNVCQQAKVSSLTWAIAPINVFMSWDETWYTNNDKWVKSIQR